MMFKPKTSLASVAAYFVPCRTGGPTTRHYLLISQTPLQIGNYINPSMAIHQKPPPLHTLTSHAWCSACFSIPGSMRFHGPRLLVGCAIMDQLPIATSLQWAKQSGTVGEVPVPKHGPEHSCLCRTPLDSWRMTCETPKTRWLGT